MSENVESVALPEGTLEEKQAQLEALMAANAEIEQNMAQNFGAAMQPADKVNVRLSCLLSKILPPEHRMEVEIMTQTMLGPILTKMYSEVETQFKEFERLKAQQEFLQGVPGVDPNALGSPLIG